MHAAEPFEATVYLSGAARPKTVDVVQGANLKDLVGAMGIPSHLTVSLYSVIQTAAAEICNQRNTSAAIRTAGSAKFSHRHEFVQRYQTHTLQYHPKPDQVTFARAYHTLFHCPVTALFDAMLKLEDTYASCMQVLFDEYQHKQRTLRERHDSNNPSGQAILKEESDILQATLASDVDQTQRTQREEYHLFVVELFREYRQSLAALALDEQEALAMADKTLDAKEILAAAVERVSEHITAQHASPPGSIHSSSDHELLVRRRQNSSASLGSILSDTTTRNTQYEASLQKMQEMGFDQKTAEEALMQTDQDVERAIALVVDQLTNAPDKPPRQSTSTPYKRSSSLSQAQRPTFSNSPSPARSRNNSCNEPAQEVGSRRHSLQKMATAPSLLGGTGGSNNARTTGWSPISFLQQQKQVVMDSSNLGSVLRIGGWFGKGAPSAVTSSHHNGSEFVESFHISPGTALFKSEHYLRLLVPDMSLSEINSKPYNPEREMAYRVQMATTLYTSHLSAMVVLVEQRDLDSSSSGAGWHQYMSGKTNNKALFERCQRSTEFHFPTIEAQLSDIQKDFADAIPEEGTFFITRHSNLPSTQVVFHLVVNNESEKEPIDQHHTMIRGLRNILHIATRFDITSLIIPLLLLPDRNVDHPETLSAESLELLCKRGEAAMKCVKGFLIEHSRNRKHAANEFERSGTVLGAELNTVEFHLPNQPELYASQSMSGNRQQSKLHAGFQHFRTQLKEIFKTN